MLAGKEAEACQSYTIETNFLVAGLGQLSEPYRPGVADEASFRGKIMHSARWDWSYDLRDKRVGIIGNGEQSTIPVVQRDWLLTHRYRRHRGTDRSRDSQGG